MLTLKEKVIWTTILIIFTSILYFNRNRTTIVFFAHNEGFGRRTLENYPRIKSDEQLNEIEKSIMKDLGINDVIVLNWKEL